MKKLDRLGLQMMTMEYNDKVFFNYIGNNKYQIRYARTDYKTNKRTFRNKGIFDVGEMIFQFAGEFFQMSGSKVYRSSLKKIFDNCESWVALNLDRKGQVRNTGYYGVIFKEVIKAHMSVVIEEAIYNELAKE